MHASAYISLIVLSLTIVILLFYYLYFFARLANYKEPKNNMLQEHPVSIIICGKNEAANFAQNIPFIQQQQYTGSLEIIVVDDGSADTTKSVLSTLTQHGRPLQVITIKNDHPTVVGKKFPLSTGVLHATHELLLLTDADCMPASGKWLFHMQAAYIDGIDIVLGYGAYKKLPGALNKLIRFETFHSALQYLSYALAGETYMGVGRNMSYKKSIFEKNGGFATISHIPGGDDDLFINQVATKANTAIVINKEAHTISEPKKTWSSWMQQKTRHFSTSKYYKARHKFLLGLYSLSQFLFYPAFIAALILYSWHVALFFFMLKSLVQQLIFGKAMKKLHENDLVKWVLFMDLWMVFYYLIFAPALFRKEKKTWN